MKCACLLASLLVYAELALSDELCPPWFLYNSNITITSAPQQHSHCVCGEHLRFGIKCDAQDYTSSLISGNCAFWDNRTGRTVAGHCPYVFPQHLLVGRTMKLPQDVHTLNSWLCSHLNRETHSTGCGRCTNGTGPSVSSPGSQCTHCTPVNILYYLLLHYLPATVIFILMLLAQFDINSTPVAAYILFSSAWIVYLQTPDGFSTYVAFTAKHYRYTMRAVFILHSIFSFDPLYFISPPLCISSHMDDIDVQYFVVLKTLYPFMLLLVAYIGIELHARDFKPVVLLWRPIFRKIIRLRRSWNPHVSLVQAFSTIFLISYLKLISLAFVPFILTDFVDDHGEYVQHSIVTYIDPTVPVGHSKQLYLITVSIVLLVFIILPPPVVLIVYPTRPFRKLQKSLPARLNIALKTYVSTIQGFYKDGTDGTRDYRSLYGVTLAMFMALMALQYGLALLSNRRPLIIWHVNVILFVLYTVTIAVLRPHKYEMTNHMGVCIGALLSIGSTIHICVATYFTVDMRVIFVAVSVVSIPHFLFYGYIIHRIGSKLGFKKSMRKCCRVVTSREMEQQEILN